MHAINTLHGRLHLCNDIFRNHSKVETRLKGWQNVSELASNHLVEIVPSSFDFVWYLMEF